MADKEEKKIEDKPTVKENKEAVKTPKKGKKAQPEEKAKVDKPKKEEAEPKEEAKETKPKKGKKAEPKPKAIKEEAEPKEEAKEEKAEPEGEEGTKPTDDVVDEKPKKASRKKEKKDEGPFPEEMMFGKYNVTDVVVEDPGLSLLINLDPALVPHSSARHANKPFYKGKISIVERLINGMMRTGRYTGKKTKSYKVVYNAFEIIEKRTKENPIQILVRALERSAPREEVTRLKFGGISVPKAVDSSPSRRLDTALRNICLGTVRASHKNKKSIYQCLATELLAASNGDMQRFAVSNKVELEWVAKSAHLS